MLVQFQFENFKSFKDKTCLSFIASNYFKEQPENLIENKRYSLLKSIVVYGANASGKSKLLEAIGFMRFLIQNSSRDSVVSKDIKIDPFKLNTGTINKPSSFEAVLLCGDTQYRYGFEVTKNEIVSEWLYKKITKEVELFYRDHQKIDFHSVELPKAKLLVEADMVRNKALMLSVLAQFNDKTAQKIVTCFSDINLLSAIDGGYEHFSVQALSSSYKDKIIQLMHDADMGINNMELNIISKEELPDEVIKIIPPEDLATKKIANDITTFHTQYDENLLSTGEEIPFLLHKDESKGTGKFFALIGPIVDTLENGRILLVDELDSGLHHDLTQAIIKLFHSPETNPRGAQLIFNSHNTNLLTGKAFRRDQIYLVNKNQYGESSLSSVSDYKVKITDNLEKRYLDGQFAALPYLNDFGENLKTSQEHGN